MIKIFYNVMFGVMKSAGRTEIGTTKTPDAVFFMRNDCFHQCRIIGEHLRWTDVCAELTAAACLFVDGNMDHSIPLRTVRSTEPLREMTISSGMGPIACVAQERQGS